MQPTNYAAVSCIAALLLGGCDFAGSTSTGYGSSSATSADPPAAAASGGATVNPGFNTGGGGTTGSINEIVATPSVAGTLAVTAGSSQTITVTFTSSDGLPIRGLAISGTTLPSGWSGTSNYNCTLVGAGNSCVVTLTYAPSAADSGTLNLNYIYIDNANQPEAPGRSLAIPYVATASNNVAVSVSPTGQVSSALGGNQSVSINFTTDDGNVATNLSLTSDLKALPAGWSSAAQGLSCGIVSTGNGCQVVLSYAPSATASGVLALSYAYTDDSGASRTAALNIPYSTTTNGEVVANVAPGGQVNAVEPSGRQSVAINFTTDDGKAASHLQVTSALSSLPAGWSSSASQFSCSNVSTGNGCQLLLSYAPTAPGRGVLSLNYSYLDAAGTFNVGSVNIEYAATTDDNAVATASPSGQVNAVVGMGSQTVTATFTTDDGRPATALQLNSDLTSLPPGWSSTDSSFTCSGFSSGTGCQLPLTYTPTAAGSGTLTLTYAYLNNAGVSKAGSLNILFRATTDDNVVATPSQTAVAVPSGNSTTVDIVFATDDGNPASDLAVTSGLSPLPSGWSSASSTSSCATVSAGTSCELSLTYAPAAADAGTLTLGFSYTNNSGVVKTGTVAIGYVATP